MPKQKLIIVGWNILILLVLILVVDTGARLFIRERSNKLFNDSELFMGDRPFITDHQLRGFALQPNFSSALVRINSEGFRGSDFPAAFPSLPWLIILLCSLTDWAVSLSDSSTSQFKRLRSGLHLYKSPQFR